MKQIVIISRKWNHPKISMVVTDEMLSFAIDLPDFIDSVKVEMGLSKESSKMIDQAVDNVLKGIKGESVRVMG